MYEGTSEIMEWTIARDRWRQHLMSRGDFYNAWAARLEELHQREPQNGAGTAALALRALAVILERCREDRLTRNQHIFFRLGELITYATWESSNVEPIYQGLAVSNFAPRLVRWFDTAK